MENLKEFLYEKDQNQDFIIQIINEIDPLRQDGCSRKFEDEVKFNLLLIELYSYELDNYHRINFNYIPELNQAIEDQCNRKKHMSSLSSYVRSRGEYELMGMSVYDKIILKRQRLEKVFLESSSTKDILMFIARIHESNAYYHYVINSESIYDVLIDSLDSDDLEIKKISTFIAVEIINQDSTQEELKLRLLLEILLVMLSGFSPVIKSPEIEISNYNKILTPFSNGSSSGLDYSIRTISSLIDKGKWQIALYLVMKSHEISKPLMLESKVFLASKIISKVEFDTVDDDVIFCFSMKNMPDYLNYNLAEWYVSKGNTEKAMEILDFLRGCSYPESKLLILDKFIKNKNFLMSCVDGIKTPDEINSLSGREFEVLLVEKFREYGLKVEETKVTGDFGADLIVEDRAGKRFAIQCKRYSSKVNLKAIQEVVSACAYYYCDAGLVITNNNFLKSAIDLAQKNNVELWGQDQLLAFIHNKIFQTKIRLEP